MENLQTKDDEAATKKAVELYQQGAEAWKKGYRAQAMTLYSESARLDPDGPGAAALEMSQNIMNFYDRDRYNP